MKQSTHKGRHIRRLALFAVLLILALLICERLVEQHLTAEPVYRDAAKTMIGDKLCRQRNQTVTLIMGLDDLGPIVSSGSYNNTQQADFLVLLAIDPKDHSYSLLHINRDTMADVDLLDISGARTGNKTQAQIALSHAYGDGLESSCLNTRRAVSNLLFGMRIDHYVALSMGAVGRLTDYFGGIPITMPTDHTDIDPVFSAGAEITLDGQQALSYVRSRMNVDDGSNLSRMARQRDFMNAFIAHLQSLSLTEEEWLGAYQVVNGSDEGGRYLLTDATAQELLDNLSILAEKKEYTLYSMQGTADDSGTYVEFYPDRAALEELACQLYFDLME